MQVFYWLLGKGRATSETDVDGNAVVIYRRDPLFVLLVVLPIIVSAMAFVAGLMTVPLGFLFPVWIPLIFLAWMSFWFTALLFGLVAWYCFATFFPLVPVTMIAVRQFLGSRVFFTDCRIFTFPGFTSTVFLSGDIETKKTAASPTSAESYKVVSMLKTAGSATGDNQFLRLAVTYQLPVDTRPLQVMQNFVANFATTGIEEMHVMTIGQRMEQSARLVSQQVEEQVMTIIVAQADAIVCTHELEEVQFRRKRVNDELTQHFITELAKIAVNVTAVAVEDVQDLLPGGIISQHTRATRSEEENKAEARIATAESSRRIVASKADLSATRTEQKNLAAVAKIQTQTLVEQTAAEKQKAILELQRLIETMKTMEGGKQGEFALSKLRDMNPEQLTTIANELAKALKMPDQFVGVGVDLHWIVTAIKAFLGQNIALPPTIAGNVNP